ncbi:Uncharacterized protein TPAR_07689 [Tolypocladium paradoxum]|uniref:Integral membrane protein n=1 Tax=Tolypocladium paradoxum TaxID=94208 RepID=A0A2S4KPI7_9HYPO|nr:Uncharacterized protein TPAR_07689 [Tolypocladium paradoxum]
MKASGTPNDVVRCCPEDRIVGYSLYWYHPEDMPEYLICTRCHADHVEGTSLAAKFKRVKRPDGSASTCGFWYPRIKETLWPLAVRINNSDNLLAFMKRRLEVNSCKGRVMVNGAEGVKWFGMAANEIEGFIACEACYEDRVMGTAFEPRFTPYHKQGADEKWMCDMCVPYISRAVAEMSKRNDWSGFVAGSTLRLGLPACEGKDVQSNALNWYMPRREIENMYVCEACYMDKLAMTLFDAEFQRHQPSSGFDAWMEQLGQRWTCMLSDSTVSMIFALQNAIYQRDYAVFSNAARTICGLVPCTANGIIRGNWWTMTGGCDGLSVCEACHAGILQTGGVGTFFEPVQRDREATIVCSFCIASPRFVQFLGKYAETLDKGVFSYYSDHVKKFAGVQACPGRKHREKARWWGYPEALFCEDCYLDFVAATPLASTLVIKGEYEEQAHICQIWSRRMRTMFLEACAAGAPGSPESQAAVDKFRAFGSRRLQVYLQTVPRIDFIRGMMELKMVSAMNQGMLSLMYSGMNSQAVLSGTTDDCLHGNNSLGWYETEHGATGAQMFNNMQTGMSEANRPDEWMQIMQLEIMWKEVE